MAVIICRMSLRAGHDHHTQGALEAVPLETAYKLLTAKWERYFERGHDDNEEEPQAGEGPAQLPGKPKRRSLFKKLQTPSRSQACNFLASAFALPHSRSSFYAHVSTSMGMLSGCDAMAREGVPAAPAHLTLYTTPHTRH